MLLTTFWNISALYLRRNAATLQGTVADSSAGLTWGLGLYGAQMLRCCMTFSDLLQPSISAEEPYSNTKVVIIVHLIPIILYFTQAKKYI